MPKVLSCPLEAACHSNSFQRESSLLALSSTEPLVLPGDIIRVFIQKEGQGFEQGIAHLDDGTMVVIDHGADLVGQAIDVEVTRFMQTNTGRMIFAIHESHEPALARNQVSFPQHIPSHVSI
ncbi:MAG: TRAM domain-containing protein [Nitrospirae bacterium]|nr:TRAM domain-containing protein [Nitrospirota bacterium]